MKLKALTLALLVAASGLMFSFVPSGDGDMKELESTFLTACAKNTTIASALGEQKLQPFCKCIFGQLKKDGRNDYTKVLALMQDKPVVERITQACYEKFNKGQGGKKSK